MQDWFNNLRRQEQMLLLFGAVAVTGYLLLVIVFQPLSESVDALKRQNQAAQQSLDDVQSLAAEYQALQHKVVPSKGRDKQSITRLIDSTVKGNGLEMKRFQPSSSGDVQVRFENAVFNKILSWLRELESGNGVLIKDLSVSPGAASGLVNVSVRLRQGE